MKPKLRNLEFIPIEQKGDEYFLARDHHGFSQEALLPRAWGPLLGLLDGAHDTAQIIFQYLLQYGEVLPREIVENIIAQLDDALLLESPHFHSHRKTVVQEFENASTRASTLAGSSYPEDAEALRLLLQDFFEEAEKIAELSPRPPDAQIKGAVVPHIDFARGGATEALAYQHLQNEQFDTLVVLGIAHAGVQYPFCAADKDFQTPLGTARCDREFLADLNSRVGNKMLNEQYAHKNEHSIEFVAVFLQFLEPFKNTKIVPIICGGFFEELETGNSPLENPEIAQFVAALRATVKEHEARGKKIGFIASVDGAHIGSRFGDDRVLTPQSLRDIETQDLQFLSCIENGDRDALHAELSKDNNARNVDAHPAVYTLLAAFPELRAQLLDYDQAFDAEANSVVSFAAMTLYQ